VSNDSDHFAVFFHLTEVAIDLTLPVFVLPLATRFGEGLLFGGVPDRRRALQKNRHSQACRMPPASSAPGAERKRR